VLRPDSETAATFDTSGATFGRAALAQKTPRTDRGSTRKAQVASEVRRSRARERVPMQTLGAGEA